MKTYAVAAITALLLAAAAPVLAQQGTGYLKAKVHPGRAGVFIDGKYVGPAANFKIARKYVVAAGEHEVKFSDPRYEDLATRVKIEPGKTTKISEKMKALPAPKPPFGRLRIISPDKFAAVYINGRFMGHADEFSNVEQGLLLNPGEYKVKIVPVGSEQGHEEQIKLEADKVVVVRSEK